MKRFAPRSRREAARRRAAAEEIKPFDRLRKDAVEALRYRAEDAAIRGRSAVREARVRELKTEPQQRTPAAHFEDNPEDLNLLKHDVSLSKHPALPHLSHLPAYPRAQTRGRRVGRGEKTGRRERGVVRGRGGTVRVWAEEATSPRAAGGRGGREGRREGALGGALRAGDIFKAGRKKKMGRSRSR